MPTLFLMEADRSHVKLRRAKQLEPGRKSETGDGDNRWNQGVTASAVMDVDSGVTLTPPSQQTSNRKSTNRIT